jgi:hypothetical protein
MPDPREARVDLALSQGPGEGRLSDGALSLIRFARLGRVE